ncbi:TonB family protein, partial [Porticoccaceae bacterium]|nr:TonB family protein [Porticoccaceae bacterium]
PNDRFMKLILQPTKLLKCLLRGMQIAMLLNLASVATAQSDLVMNGSSVYSDLGKDQFAAALYLETQQQNPSIAHSMQGEKRMEVRVLNNYSKRRWFNLWMQSISINNSRENFSESAQDLVTLMQAAKSAPQKGDLIEYLSSPDKGTSMRFNGTELVADLPADVFGLLLNTWIGSIPPTTSFKDEILGKQRNPTAVELLETVTTDPKRVSLAASWILPPEPKAVGAVAKVKPKPAIKKTSKAKAATPAKLQDTPAPVATKPITPVTAIAATSAVADTKQGATKDQLTSDANTSVSKGDDHIETSDAAAGEDSEAVTDSEDEADFSIAEALAMRDYTPLVVQAIYKKISYPSRAIDRGFEGTVRMVIVVSQSGALEKVTVAQKSRHSILNKAAIKATERAAPFPALPAALNTDEFEITVPITFKLK